MFCLSQNILGVYFGLLHQHAPPPKGPNSFIFTKVLLKSTRGKSWIRHYVSLCYRSECYLLNTVYKFNIATKKYLDQGQKHQVILITLMKIIETVIYIYKIDNL